MIKNIVFDMGQVLLRFDTGYFIRRLGIEGPDEQLLQRQVFRSVEWVMMDRGSLTEAEATARVCKRLPEHLHEAAQKLVCLWDRPLLPIPGMFELVEELKQAGYGLYLLSNASVRQHVYWPQLPCAKLFDGKLISADVHLLKPDPEIYRLLFSRFDLKPEECFFVDDSPVNIEGALNCGMDGAVFHGDCGQLRKDMLERGIRIREE